MCDYRTWSAGWGRHRFRQALAHAVWEAAGSEDSPYPYPEVQTLLDGVPVGGDISRLGEADFYDAPAAGDGGTNLRRLLSEGMGYLINEVADPGLQGLLYLPLAIQTQFHFDGIRRTARRLVNGHLMLHSIQPIGVPVGRRRGSGDRACGRRDGARHDAPGSG